MTTVYSLGLRLQEPLRLQVSDIDSGRMLVHVGHRLPVTDYRAGGHLLGALRPRALGRNKDVLALGASLLPLAEEFQLVVVGLRRR